MTKKGRKEERKGERRKSQQKQKQTHRPSYIFHSTHLPLPLSPPQSVSTRHPLLRRLCLFTFVRPSFSPFPSPLPSLSPPPFGGLQEGRPLVTSPLVTRAPAAQHRRSVMRGAFRRRRTPPPRAAVPFRKAGGANDARDSHRKQLGTSATRDRGACRAARPTGPRQSPACDATTGRTALTRVAAPDTDAIDHRKFSAPWRRRRAPQRPQSSSSPSRRRGIPRRRGGGVPGGCGKKETRGRRRPASSRARKLAGE